ncbi:MAG: polymer-forming cytoskeletal protein [Acidobacteria bacterium]|nr:polymer-forming cytoskeletal protein [Acidobacteriota bacterium]MXZ61493.1 polymer-forming cytoskeletal protein [Acidobacteriota bacterium]MYA47137.1 polymer-forming cytoskeletal protein [Acidobacteriota bacterium]MYF13115.1 polymer-forming cytoskeletal protein [Acidobacteriota bacterium]MYI37486.1 polymer-forming cytoskeletal protein [Acidobacteriota bacterium]
MAIFRRTHEEEAFMTEAPPAPERGARSTWIGQDTLVEGKITTREDICIQGRLKGSVESTAAVLIPEGGQVEADILARNVTIHGRVTGDVEAVEKAEIGASGVLTGGILAATVVVHAGATFEGTVRTRSKPEPKPEKKTPKDETAA